MLPVFQATASLLTSLPAICHSNYARLRSPIALLPHGGALHQPSKVHSLFHAPAGSNDRTFHLHIDPKTISYHRSVYGIPPRCGPRYRAHHRTVPPPESLPLSTSKHTQSRRPSDRHSDREKPAPQKPVARRRLAQTPRVKRLRPRTHQPPYRQS